MTSKGRIPIASDHAGYELKHALIEHLRAANGQLELAGIKVKIDFKLIAGTHS